MSARTRKFEREDGWSVVGDAKTRRCAETFELPVKLRIGKSCIGLEPSAAGADETAMDALQSLAEEDAGKPRRLSSLFGSRTQGEPYHSLIVAVATLIENRLPRLALACGDFDIEDADHARHWLDNIFGETFERPVLLEPKRIRARAPNLDAVGLSKRHTIQVAPELSPILRKIRERLNAQFSVDLEHIALVCTDVCQLDEGIRIGLKLLGTVLASAATHLPLVPTGQERARILLQTVAKRTTCQDIRLTDMAWDSIESADDETREFLYQFCHLESDGLEVRRAFLGIYENPVVRDHVMAAWRSGRHNPGGIPAELADMANMWKTMSSWQHNRL